jgi:hypothetical protein
MRDHGSHEAVHLHRSARDGAELGGDRPREAQLSCRDGLACGGVARHEQVEGGVRAGDLWEVDYVVGVRG